METPALPRALFERAKALGITEITLSFSGGSDEGYLTVECKKGDESVSELNDEIEKWAWDVYDYGGAGDGSDYGDDIVYNLSTMKITATAWADCPAACASDYRGGKLKIGD